MTKIYFQNQEIEELTKICDELIAKLGTTDWEDILTVRFSHMPCLTQTHSGPAQHIWIAFFLSFFHESDSATGRKINETYVYGFKSADVRLFPYRHNPLSVVRGKPPTYLILMTAVISVQIFGCFDTWVCNGVLGSGVHVKKATCLLWERGSVVLFIVYMIAVLLFVTEGANHIICNF